MKNFFKKEKVKGFTLLETIIAIAILILAITATIGASSTGLSDSISAREQVTAFFLAQDAIEYIKNLKDTKGLEGLELDDTWTFFKDDLLSRCESGCRVDTTKTTGAIESCSLGSSCSQLNKYTDGRFGHGGGSPTNFSRTVTVTKVSSNTDELHVTVIMTWTKTNKVKTFTVSENIFNWI